MLQKATRPVPSTAIRVLDLAREFFDRGSTELGVAGSA